MTQTSSMEDGEAFIQHFGKKGMKWGVRKARTEKQGGEDARVKYTKKASKLTDDELAKRVKRLEMEKKYDDLRNPNKRGKKFVDEVLFGSGNQVVKKLITNAALLGVRSQMEKKGKTPELAELLTGMKRKKD